MTFNLCCDRPPEIVGNIGFWGNLLPDFGFPDKKMAILLDEIWPDENWTRFASFDLYKWYQTAIEAGQNPLNPDSSYNPIINWVKNNSPYPDKKVVHWFAAFKRGIQENWVTGVQIGTQMAPAHEGRKVAEALGTGFTGLGNLPGTLKSLAIAGTVLIVAYYGMPLLSKVTGGRSYRKFKRVRA